MSEPNLPPDPPAKPGTGAEPTQPVTPAPAGQPPAPGGTAEPAGPPAHTIQAPAGWYPPGYRVPPRPRRRRLVEMFSVGLAGLLIGALLGVGGTLLVGHLTDHRGPGVSADGRVHPFNRGGYGFRHPPGNRVFPPGGRLPNPNPSPTG